MIQLGIENLLRNGQRFLRGKRLGLLTNMTGVDGCLHSTIALLSKQKDCRLTTLFGPEHGIRGDAKEGAEVGSFVDQETGCPVFSLYGKTRKPKKEWLKSIDCLIIDIQDIGARYYTFTSTLGLVMEACMEGKKQVIVLDRPNPINGINREGNLVQKDLRSFVGSYPLPNRHGLTIGELAMIYKYKFGLNCDLIVVPMKGWKRSMVYRDTGLSWVQPSPNSTGESMAILYPGMCLLEGTTLSEGRGTTRPFEIVGAPFINGSYLANNFNRLNLDGIIARPTSFVPFYSKYCNQVCYGIQLHITAIEKVESLKTGLNLLGLIAEMYPNQFSFIHEPEKRCFFNLLAGDQRVKGMIRNNKFETFFQECGTFCETFSKQAEDYLLYN